MSLSLFLVMPIRLIRIGMDSVVVLQYSHSRAFQVVKLTRIHSAKKYP